MKYGLTIATFVALLAFAFIDMSGADAAPRTSACVKQCNDTWQACRRSCDRANDNCHQQPLIPNSTCDNLWAGCMAQNCNPQRDSCVAACESKAKKR